MSVTRADFVSQTSKGGNIFLSFSYRDAHRIVGGCFSLAFAFFICDSHPLLILNNVRVDPHCFPLRSRHWDEAFLLLVVRISIDHSKFPFRDGNHSNWC